MKTTYTLKITKTGLPYYISQSKDIIIPKEHFYKHFPEENPTKPNYYGQDDDTTPRTQET